MKFNFIHKELAAGKWNELTLMEQLSNIGSEVHRTIVWHRKNDKESFQNAFYRALELFDLTMQDNRWRGRTKEIARSREVFCDYFAGDNQYNLDLDSFDKYFLQFTMAAQIQRRDKR